jgi:glycosyltransferase involved in cell wall biosynthesis
LVKVSTIIPVYNGERTIAQAIDSALSQDYKGHEVIVVNDGSTDSTAAILNGYGDRIRIVSVPNGGLARARNVGVAESTGKYLAFLDADDAWLPKKLRTMVTALEGNRSAALAFSEHRFIDKDGVECGESSFGHPPSMDELLTRPVPIVPSAWLLTRQVFDHIGGFCERFKGAEGFEDTWMLLLLRELGEFVYVSEGLTLYCGHGSLMAEKYTPGLSIIIPLLKERYGVRSRRWIRYTKNGLCRQFLSIMAHQMNDGDKLGALRTFTRLFKLRPVYFLRPEFLSLLCAPQNTRRLWQLISVWRRLEGKSDASGAQIADP